MEIRRKSEKLQAEQIHTIFSIPWFLKDRLVEAPQLVTDYKGTQIEFNFVNKDGMPQRLTLNAGEWLIYNEVSKDIFAYDEDTFSKIYEQC